MSTVQSPKHPKFISEEGAGVYSRSKPDGMFSPLVLMEGKSMFVFSCSGFVHLAILDLFIFITRPNLNNLK